MPLKRRRLSVLVFVGVGAVAVVKAHQHTRAIYADRHAVVRVAHRVAVLVAGCDCDKRKLTAIAGNRLAVSLQADIALSSKESCSSVATTLPFSS